MPEKEKINSNLLVEKAKSNVASLNVKQKLEFSAIG